MFSTLSGLTQHLEARALRNGALTYQNAVSSVGEQLLQLGLPKLKMLMEGI